MRSAVPRQRQYSNPRFHLIAYEVSDDLRAVVCRVVINDQDLDIAQCLADQAHQRALNITLLVVERDDDCDGDVLVHRISIGESDKMC